MDWLVSLPLAFFSLPLASWLFVWHCNRNEISVARATNIFGGCHFWRRNKHYCCPRSKPAPLKTTTGTEEEIAHTIPAPMTKSRLQETTKGMITQTVVVFYFIFYLPCWLIVAFALTSHLGVRKKSLCCKPSHDAIPCAKQPRQIDSSYRCGPDLFADEPEEGKEVANPLAAGIINKSVAEVEDDFPNKGLSGLGIRRSFVPAKGTLCIIGYWRIRRASLRSRRDWFTIGV